MNANRSASFAIAFLSSVLFFVVPGGAQDGQHRTLDMTVVSPESVGFSAERIERLHAYMKQVIDEKELSGMVTILARHGKVVDYWNYGQRDMASGAPMTKDTIFRDFSMTKPVTGVAMMILYEQGKWLPSDPISKFIPEFAHLKVLKGVDAEGKAELEDPQHAPTMAELMSHTAGFTYGFFGNTPVDRLAIGVPYADKSNIKRWAHTGGGDKRCRGNNWFVPYKTIRSREQQRPHPATFPVELAEQCIKLHGAEAGLVVMDPFVGIGHSAVAAKNCGVGKFIGFEIDGEYLAEAREAVGRQNEE